MNDLAEVEPSALSVWLRTGRWPRPSEATLFKFNPNHDPADGRFTFTGGGGSWGGGGSSAGWLDPATQFPRKPVSKPPLRVVAPPVAVSTRSTALGAAKPQLRHIVANGYDYGIDEQGRTRSVSGDLTLNHDQARSRRAQREAGGTDRQAGDEGGHYIARRFNGPTEAFNHFAQYANFNRRDYASLESQWEKAKRAGKTVSIRIVPQFEGRSSRPVLLNISLKIGGNRESVKLPNSRKEKHDATAER